MNETIDQEVVRRYQDFIEAKTFPCVGAKAALSRNQMKYLVVDHIACPKDDALILQFIYDFIDDFRKKDSLYFSAVVIFKGPLEISPETFDQFFWERVQSLSNLDAIRYKYDLRVGNDPEKGDFSFSLKEEAFYMIGLHPGNSRIARRFTYPAIVFNPHAQFEKLRETNKYDSIKHVIRNRDVKLSGSINPMLADFGESSEVYQYTGYQYDNNWKCPFIDQHGKTESDSAA